MRRRRPRTAIDSFVAILCVVGLLTSTAFVSVTPAIAADTWEPWPRSPALRPDLTPKTETSTWNSGRPEDAAEMKMEKGTSSKTLWWVAAGIAVAVGIAIAVGSGGGNNGGSTTVNPGHH